MFFFFIADIHPCQAWCSWISLEWTVNYSLKLISVRLKKKNFRKNLLDYFSIVFLLYFNRDWFGDDDQIVANLGRWWWLEERVHHWWNRLNWNDRLRWARDHRSTNQNINKRPWLVDWKKALIGVIATYNFE